MSMSSSRIGPLGLALIKGYEKLRLTAYAATEEERAKGIWTIGWGHTAGVKEGDTCTAEEADQFLLSDLEKAEGGVYSLVRTPLNQNQYDALVSLVFNIGRGNFAASTILKRLNLGDYAGAAQEFKKWNKQAGKVLGGLTKRRAEEEALFNKPSEGG